MASLDNSIVCQLCARDGVREVDCPYCEILNEYPMDYQEMIDGMNRTRTFIDKPTSGEAQSRNVREAKRFE